MIQKSFKVVPGYLVLDATKGLHLAIHQLHSATPHLIIHLMKMINQMINKVHDSTFNHSPNIAIL